MITTSKHAEALRKLVADAHPSWSSAQTLLDAAGRLDEAAARIELLESALAYLYYSICPTSRAAQYPRLARSIASTPDVFIKWAKEQKA